MKVGPRRSHEESYCSGLLINNALEASSNPHVNISLSCGHATEKVEKTVNKRCTRCVHHVQNSKKLVITPDLSPHDIICIL